jgi:hypothetical protein
MYVCTSSICLLWGKDVCTDIMYVCTYVHVQDTYIHWPCSHATGRSKWGKGFINHFYSIPSRWIDWSIMLILLFPSNPFHVWYIYDNNTPLKINVWNHPSLASHWKHTRWSYEKPSFGKGNTYILLEWGICSAYLDPQQTWSVNIIFISVYISLMQLHGTWTMITDPPLPLAHDSWTMPSITL